MSLNQIYKEPISIIQQTWPENTEPVVSIQCITYNHENYICDAIEGFLMQKTTFPVEILIHDDASTDNTANILRGYEAKYPQLIKPIYQTVNKYSTQRGYISRIQNERTKGKYIAKCEGDDYWTDPLKLQKQVDFLEENEEYGMVHTDADQFYTRSGKAIHSYHQQNNKSHNDENAFEEILKSNYPVFTCTTLFRRNLLNSIEFSETKGFKMGDTFLWLEFAQKSKIKYLPESTAVRQVLKESATQSNDWNKKLQFKKSGYDLMKHFINKYGASKETEQIVHYKFNKVIIGHAYRAKDLKHAKEALKWLSNHSKATFEDKIRCWGIKNYVYNFFANMILFAIKLKKKIN